MMRRLGLRPAAALSLHSSLMLAAFALMYKLGTPGFGASGLLAAVIAAAVSAYVTHLTLAGGGVCDDYQAECLNRVTAVTGAISGVLMPGIAIAGIALESLGFAVCAGMLARWALLLADAAAAAVIRRWK